MTDTLTKFVAMLAITAALSGCGAILAGTAGGLIVDEGIVENDGEFDPFENTEAGQAVQSALD